jgi:hypothetical protein
MDAELPTYETYSLMKTQELAIADAMSTFDDPTIYCQRCGGAGAYAFRGWQILCRSCIDKEIGEHFD